MPAGFQYPVDFIQHRWPFRHELQALLAADRVKMGIRPGQGQGVAFPPVHGGAAFTGDGQHVAAEIQPVQLQIRALLVQAAGQRAGAAGQVQHAPARGRFQPLQQLFRPGPEDAWYQRLLVLAGVEAGEKGVGVAGVLHGWYGLLKPCIG